ncbi:hypothetical protein [Nocardia flavorosea]|uniref:Uncharacterized protein n=1 Tax=Nocardia flavorosea TaxID=53429 RepID=A0A846YT15_9NOCA|nr:hypothetical protein [Nocardia flavorosea]NKY60422.1 hypothetical protein [Nocardia flavorosea]
MPILTREAIAHINSYYEYAERCDEAYFYGRYEDEKYYGDLSRAAEAKVTPAQMDAYLDAGIRPPYNVGQKTHDTQVDAYFASFEPDPPTLNNAVIAGIQHVTPAGE